MEETKESGSKIGRFFSEVKTEMGKVTWPTRSDLWGATVVVITVTVLVSAVTGVLDYALGKVMEFLIAIPLG